MLKKFAVLTAVFIIAAICVATTGCGASLGYELREDGDGNKYYVARCSGYSASLSGALEIPAYYGEGDDRAPVTEIAEEGFAGAKITKLVIPETVTKIGAAAFSYCYGLREAAFAEGSRIEEIPNGAFAYCRVLQEFKVPSTVKNIGRMAFYNCFELSGVGLPEGLETISPAAFSNCVALKGVVLPQTLKIIGYEAFYTTAIEEITIPASVKDGTVTDENGQQQTLPGIGYAAFHTCKSLKKVIIKADVSVIKSGTFGYCTALEEIYLPNSVKEVEGGLYSGGKIYYGHPFHNNAALKKVYFSGTEQEWNALKEKTDKSSVSENSVAYNNSAFLSAEVLFNVAL